MAHHLVTTTTSDHDLVVDAFPVNEVALLAAAKANRNAIGCVPRFPLAQHIRARADAELSGDENARVELRACRADQMTHGLADRQGEVALILAAPPTTSSPPSKRRTTTGCPACRTGLRPRSHEHEPLRPRSFLPAAAQVLRPGGTLAVVTTTRHDPHGELHDPAPSMIRAARATGLRYTQHIIAVQVPVDGDTLLIQARPESLGQLRDIRSRALPPAARVHADICLFTKTPADVAGEGQAR